MKAAWALLGVIAAANVYMLGVLSEQSSPTTSAPSTGTVLTVNTPDGKCHEDDPCWASSHVIQPDTVPGWVNCNLIHNIERWQVCYANINDHHAVWRYVGRYDHHTGVWKIPGPTTVYVNRVHWSTSS